MFIAKDSSKQSDEIQAIEANNMKTHFHKKGFVLRLVLKVRVFGTGKWPIVFLPMNLSLL